MSIQVVPVMHVTDVNKAVEYYTNVLGFTLDFRWKDYAGVVFGGEGHLHLNGFGATLERNGKGQVYFMVPNADEIYVAMVERGAVIDHHIDDNAYMMRDFSVLDPDGNRYTFGTAIPEEREETA